MTRTLPGLGAAVLAAVAAGAAPAQETSDNRVAASTDWSVFQETDPVECFSVSAPTSQENTRDGESVTVQRGDALLFVFYRPAEGVTGQVTFTGGYPFAANLPVTIEIGDSTFQLFTEGEWAWPASPEEDARIVEAMKAGSEAVVSGESGRGTVTRDTFSLIGFTSAVEEAQSRCPT